MNIYNFLLNQIRVKNLKDLLLLLLKIAIIAFVCVELYDDFRYLLCTMKNHRQIIPFSIAKRVSLFLIGLFVCYFIYYFKQKYNSSYFNNSIVILCIVTSMVNGSIFGFFYWDGPYWGRVVDADTGKPIPGSIVVAEWEFEQYYFLSGGSTYADVRETVTDKNGLFIIPVARAAQLWPLSRIVLDEINVYKPGYDSHPPSITRVWTDEDEKKWLQYLNLRYPEFRQKYSQDYHPIDPEEYFSDPIHARHIYYSIFRVEPKIYKPSIIKLNRAFSIKEQRAALSIRPLDVGCEKYKIMKSLSLLNKEKIRIYRKEEN